MQKDVNLSEYFDRILLEAQIADDLYL